MNVGPSTNEWRSLKRILCVRLDAMGDVLMTVPAIRAVRESNPQAEICLLTSPAGAEAAKLIPEVDEILVYEAPWMKATAPRTDSSFDLRYLETLRARRFDAAIIFTVYSQSPLPAAYFCSLAEIPLRLAHCRENPYQLLTNWCPELEPEKTVRHEVQRQLELVACVGLHTSDERIKIRVGEEARVNAQALLASRGIDPNRPFIVLHTGASAPSRRYPAERFSQVLKLLAQRLGWPMVLTGTSDEQGPIESIIASARSVRRGRGAVSIINVAGLLGLEEFAALLSRSTLLVSNNTGAVHLAAATRTPVVDLYALTNPQHTPWMVPSRVLSYPVDCRYCYKSTCPLGHGDCLTKIEPERVVEAAVSLLEELGVLTPFIKATSLLRTSGELARASATAEPLENASL
jgi:lipopolysaccharide heptosyltransferase II